MANRENHSPFAIGHSPQSVLGIIGGSGVYDIDMDKARWHSVKSPWGKPSDQVRTAEINGLPVAFPTLAESQLYRSWGASVIGMTNMPEAKLAREAEICYATVAMVTDYDSWHLDHGEVDVRKVIEVLKANSGAAKRLVARVAMEFPKE